MAIWVTCYSKGNFKDGYLTFVFSSGRWWFLYIFVGIDWALALQGDQQQSEDLVRVPGCRVWSCTSQCRGRGECLFLGSGRAVEFLDDLTNSWRFPSWVGPYWASWILMDFGGRVTDFLGKMSQGFGGMELLTPWCRSVAQGEEFLRSRPSRPSSVCKSSRAISSCEFQEG